MVRSELQITFPVSMTKLLEDHPLFTTWVMMKQRCYNKNRQCYPDYGGRGIIVCAQWKDSFNQFCLDMGDKPSGLHTLDRINVNGNYEPNNCRWATIKEQNANKRRASGDKNIYIERFTSLNPIKGKIIKCVICEVEFICKSKTNKFCSKKHVKKYHQILANFS